MSDPIMDYLESIDATVKSLDRTIRGHNGSKGLVTEVSTNRTYLKIIGWTVGLLVIPTVIGLIVNLAG